MDDQKGVCLWAAALVTMAIMAPTDSAVVDVTRLLIPADNPVVRANVRGADVVDAVVNLIYHTCIFPEDYLALRRLAYVESKDGVAMGTYDIWGVTPDMFNATTNTSNPVLQATYGKIRKAFGIDWSSVQYEDLQKPLYSALAALLYVTSQETPIPSSSETQAAYWQSNYPSSRSTANYTILVEHWKGACSGSEQADVVFVVDATTSTDNFKKALDYIRTVVEGFELGSSRIRVELYQFGPSDRLHIEFDFDSYDSLKSDILEAISSTSQIPGDTTFAPDTGVHIQNVLASAFASSERPNAARILVLVTDSTPASKTSMQIASDMIQFKGVSIITVGISSGVSLGDLVTIATQPVCTHQMQVETFQHLKDLVELTQFRVCREPMIATGMIRCRVDQCRNIAFPMTSLGITIEASTTCDSGNIFISTRTPIPGLNFRDAQSTVLPTPSEPSYIPIRDNSFFVYAKFLIAGDPHLNCYALISIANGLVHSRQTRKSVGTYNVWRETAQTCEFSPSTTLPASGGTLGPNRLFSINFACPYTQQNVHDKKLFFQYPPDHTKYIHCDLWGDGFLQSCQPGFYFNPASDTCGNGPLIDIPVGRK